MKDDLLEAAARALADQTSGTSEAAGVTRARVLASLHQSRVRRRTRLAFVLPLAASFAAATAWGTVDGRAPALVRSVVELFGFAAPRTPEPAAPRAPARKGSLPLEPAKNSTAPSDRVSVPTPTPTPIPAPAEQALAVSEPTSTGIAKSSQARVNARSASQDPLFATKHALYLAAHRAHFVDRDFARAVVAWEAYLSAAPAGSFAPEARYNRALCLARLGRTAEARSALAPFAGAPQGSYRQQEASALSAALAE